MPHELPIHTLVAHNTAPSSENKIHDDEVAATLGFGGGWSPASTSTPTCASRPWPTGAGTS